jgi:cob(I)alamin adenosyltransferase
MVLKIYTKVGDKGYTKQVSGKMVPKYDLQIEALGCLDELQSYLGVVIANLSAKTAQFRSELIQRQKELYLLQADIVVKRHHQIDQAKTELLEKRIDQITALVPKIPEFILPGGSVTAANLQYARTLARRSERAMVELDQKEEKLATSNLEYINRLSDYLFTLARYSNSLEATAEQRSKD